jgi:hypothetical protein
LLAATPWCAVMARLFWTATTRSILDAQLAE